MMFNYSVFNKVYYFFVLFVVACSLASCGSKMTTKRVSTEAGDKEAMNITDDWVATDTTNAVKEIISQMEKHKGFQRYLKKVSGKTPKVFVADIQNNTSEAYFPVQDFNDELLNEFSSSGMFILIDENARARILKEIRYQNDGMVRDDDIKKIGKAYGADLLIFGNINMVPKMLDGKTLKEYSVNVRMTNIETGEEVLRTRYKISKYSKRSGTSW